MCAAEAPSICWLLRMPAVRGRFDARAAAALGVPNGPLRGALCGGATITTPEGREVRPDEVLRGGSDGERVLVVDCPTIAHLRLLRSHAVLAELRRAGGASGAEAAAPGAAPALAAVAHLTPHSVCALPEYIAWCASLPRGTAQAFLRHTPHPQRLAFVSSARLQLKLHAVHGAVFPLPRQMPPVSQGGLPAGMPPAAAALDMLGKLVIRPSERAGVCREEEKRLRLWSDSSGEVLSLDEAEVRTELTRNARLGRALAALPSELRLGDGSWQSELRRAADLTDALPEPSRNPPGTRAGGGRSARRRAGGGRVRRGRRGVGCHLASGRQLQRRANRLPGHWRRDPIQVKPPRCICNHICNQICNHICNQICNHIQVKPPRCTHCIRDVTALTFSAGTETSARRSSSCRRRRSPKRPRRRGAAAAG